MGGNAKDGKYQLGEIPTGRNANGGNANRGNVNTPDLQWVPGPKEQDNAESPLLLRPQMASVAGRVP